MHYTGSGSNRHIEVMNEREEPVGSMDYPGWFPSKARITTKEHYVYELAPVGFWQTTIAIKKDGIPYAELKRHWFNSITISFENGKPYAFRRKGIFSGNYILVDDEQREMARIGTKYKWSTWRFEYEIDVHENNLDKDVNAVLPFLLIYYTRYIRQAAS